MRNISYIRKIIIRYKNNELSDAEMHQFKSYLRNEQHKSIFEEELLNSLLEDIDNNSIEFKNELDDVFERIQHTKSLNSYDNKNDRKIIKWSTLLKVASIFLLISSMGFIIYYTNKQTIINVSKAKEPDISAGGNRAHLSIAGGESIDLKSVNEGIITKKNSLTYADGESVKTLTANSKRSVEMVLQIPRRGKYKITLSDGTKVWLNSDSKLKYPSFFEGNERKVELEGEAYFEVEKSKSKQTPFIISSKSQEVKVLGTHFNIQAYPDENECVTSLLEGKIEVSVLDNAGNYIEKILLRPGEESVSNDKAKTIKKSSFDATQSIGWKDGLFILKGQKLENIMRQISRWYNVDIEYINIKALDIKLGGVISQSNSLKEVLNAIEQISNITFQFNGQKIIVK